MNINIIVAMTKDRVIGFQNRLPWHLSEDLKRFRSLTMGKPVIMGRKTFQAIGKVLPGRQNIVLTRDRDFQFPDAIRANSFPEALQKVAPDTSDVFCIGGSEVYQLALPVTHQIYLTLIHKDYPGDARFPAWPSKHFQEVYREDYETFSWINYMRIIDL